MAEYTSDVLSSTKEKPKETTYDPFARALKSQMAAGAKQYAGKYSDSTGYDVPLAQSLASQGAYESGEYARREQAAQDKFGLAQQVDTRRGSVADRVRSALFGREQMLSESQDKMNQAERESGLKVQESQQGFRTQLGKLNFYSYQSAAERIDALHNAYKQGTLQFQMLDAARNNMLQMADIDRYFTMLKNDWEQKIKTAESEYKVDHQEMVNEFTQSSSSTGSIISGIVDLATGYLQK